MLALAALRTGLNWLGLPHRAERSIREVANAATVRADVREMLKALGTGLHGVGVIVVAWLATSFPTSCIGFRWHFWGLPATLPSYEGASAGMLMCWVYLLFADLEALKKQPRHPSNRLRLCIDASGWTVSVLLLLGLILMAGNNANQGTLLMQNAFPFVGLR